MAEADVILQIQVEAHVVTHFQDRRGREYHDLPILDLVETLLGPGGQAEYILPIVAAQRPVLQLHEGRAGVLAASGKVEAGDGLDRSNDVGFLFQQVLADLGQYRFGALGAGVGRHAHFHHKEALVFIRQEGRRNLGEQVPGADHDQQEHHEIAATARQHAADAALEALGAAVEGAVEPAEEPLFLVERLARPGGLQESGAQRRGEDQRHQHRQGHADHDGDGELAVDDARRAAEERHGNEHGGQHHTDTHQRTLDLVHRLAGRLQWRKPFLVHQPLDVLHHHDGIIHQQPDRQHHGVHGQHVDIQAEQRQQGKRAEQHHRHSQRRNQRGTETLQEQVHDQEHQQDGFQDGHYHRADGGFHHRDGIIHQQPDRQHHGVHGQHVDIQAEQRQQGKRAEQHHRHSQRRNQRGTETLQEQVHDQEHQQDGFQDGHYHRADGGFHH